MRRTLTFLALTLALATAAQADRGGALRFGCTLLDRTNSVIAGDGITSFTEQGQHNVFLLHCRVTLDSGARMVWTPANSGRTCYAKEGWIALPPFDGGGEIPTDDWTETITPSGQADLRCILRVP